MSPEEVELIAFDPPHIGMPGRKSSHGRGENGSGFAEIFVTVEAGRIIDVGFLTDIPGDGLVCASLCCDAVLGRTLGDAAKLGEEECLGALPAQMRRELARTGLGGICLQALRQALTRAAEES